MKTAIIAASSSGPNVVVTGTAGKRIRVLAYLLTSDNPNFVVWKSGTTDISGQLHMVQGGNIAVHLGESYPGGGLPVLQTNAGEDLVIDLDASQMIGGHLTYCEVTT